MSAAGWIGVDLDGTLAEYHGWQGHASIGAPIPRMVDRVKRWLGQGIEVRIVTARVSLAALEVDSEIEVRRAITDWCVAHIGRDLPVTCGKDHRMLELWDDRCVQVEPNTGRRIDGAPEYADPVAQAAPL